MSQSKENTNGQVLATLADAASASHLRRLAEKFHRELGELLNSLHDFEGVKVVKAKVEAQQSFLRAISMIPDNGFVIAVSGLQGVGKSTLANALIGMSGKEALPEGRERCEKVPVLVRTLLPGEPRQAHILPRGPLGDTPNNLMRVDPETALRVARGETVTGSDEPLLVDYPLPAFPESLLPPWVYLLVLPGYEKNSPWGDLAMASMLLADRALFVVDGSALASQRSKTLLTDSLERMGGDGLTLVVSKTDRPGQKLEDYTASIDGLGIGDFSTENGNLFFTGIGSNDPAEWEGVAELRAGLFYGLDRNMVLARASRTRQLAAQMKEFAENDVESLIEAVKAHLEQTLTSSTPTRRIYAHFRERVSEARAKAEKAAERASTSGVAEAFNGLSDRVSKTIYDKASGWSAFWESFNPWQSYEDQQEVKLDQTMKTMVNDALNGLPAKSLKAALEAFRDNLPESMLKEQDDPAWSEKMFFKGNMDSAEFKKAASDEMLAAMRPISEVMIQMLERASKRGNLDKDAMTEIAKDVLANSGIKNLRRGLVVLGFVESAEIGAQIGGAGLTPVAEAVSVPVAAAVAVVLVACAVAISLRSAKAYKVRASKQAGYLVRSSEEPIKNKIVESLQVVMDWYEDRLDKFLRKAMGPDRNEDAQFKLASQCERLSVLRAATLRALPTR